LQIEREHTPLSIAGLDPATQSASVCEPNYGGATREMSFAARTRGGWVTGSEAGHGEVFGSIKFTTEQT